MATLKIILAFFVVYVAKGFGTIRRWSYMNYCTYYLDIGKDVTLADVIFDLNGISIGDGTYMNSGEVFSGEASVKVGKFCAIGNYVSIKARTHSIEKPTVRSLGDVNDRSYGDIVIGDRVWVGDNFLIRECVAIGDDVIKGANNVVTKSVSDKVIVAGVPAKVIRYLNGH